ncbi:solute carrier family 25 member 35 [Nilaparvata lugens]|uniref:solute carrier family 25 member 35 n=1 Tax=Nilaparvata lugens TaxID=108931 RepID=UPI000B998DE1|nr:solute carrier family 25 member 35 [Nilaparvata lugens]
MEFITGAIAAIGAGIITNPLDVVKVRFQLQGELKRKGAHKIHYRNFFHAFYVIGKTEGITALQKGLGPALVFQVLLNGTRLGVYEMAEKRKLNLKPDGRVSLLNTICIGSVAGVLGAFAGSPMYLVKIQLQSQAAASIAVGHQHQHQGTIEALANISRQYGVVGLWRGVSGACVRLAVGSCSQLSGFYLTKELLEKHQVLSTEKSLLNTIVASSVGGTLTAFTMNPFDVISTRLYNQEVDKNGKGLLYKNYIDCVRKVFKIEGLSGLYKGVIPQFSRIGPHSVLCLVFWDILKDEFKESRWTHI